MSCFAFFTLADAATIQRVAAWRYRDRRRQLSNFLLIVTCITICKAEWVKQTIMLCFYIIKCVCLNMLASSITVRIIS